MPSQVLTSVENNFTRGLITESTGLNFPENAATDTSNCEYSLIGDVVRRLGINTEVNGTTAANPTVGLAVSEYTWNNPGGDGNSKLQVKQIGGIIYFFNIATSTISMPLSTQQLAGQVNLSNSLTAGQVLDTTQECQFADGNGYLFIYHPNIEPTYVTYNANSKAVSSVPISVQIRDFTGLVDGLNPNVRPSTLSLQHQYNLQNQGWTQGSAWTATSADSKLYSSLVVGTNITWTVAAGITGISNGQTCVVYGYTQFGSSTYVGISGTVISYSGTSLTIHILSLQGNYTGTFPFINWTINLTSNSGYISTWFSVEGNYPSNADVWWYFKNTSDVFDPATTVANTTLSIGTAPQGHYILNAFNQDRVTASTIAGVGSTTTTGRPTTGCWFQGRVWYTGVSGFQDVTSQSNFYTWTENIYFSQVVTGVSDFGLCYETNDPTSETLSQLLPTDGGVITIVGSGSIIKLFPIQNGLLVFANNGVWFITGSQGIGFAADDYTITKISSVKVLSNKSFVDVLGLPYFWNEEGIYSVTPSQSGSLTVEPLTVGTILTYYNTIPLASKQYARGAYDPIDYKIQWIFRSTQESNITSRYQFDSILNYNTYNKAFFPYTISGTTNNNFIQSISYINYPYISTNTPDPGFKYGMTSFNTFISYAEEYDTNYVDWGSINYVSYFVTGYKVHGQGLKKFQVPYLNVFSRNATGYLAYYLQPIWDYAVSTNTGQVGVKQFVESFDDNHGVIIKRLKVRGRGYTVQFKFSSVDGQPFDIIGWAVFETQNTSI